MSMFLYGTSGSANRYLGQASYEVANSAARLSSGMRVVAGKAGGGELSVFQTTKNTSITYAADARKNTDLAMKEQRDAALLDNINSILTQAKELVSSSSSTDAGIAAQITQLVSAASSLSLSLNTTVTLGGGNTAASLNADLTLVNTARGTVAGKAAGYEYTAIAKSAVANVYEEGAQAYIAVDFGAETAAMTRNQILQQTASAMVAQANQSANAILALFK